MREWSASGKSAEIPKRKDKRALGNPRDTYANRDYVLQLGGSRSLAAPTGNYSYRCSVHCLTKLSVVPSLRMFECVPLGGTAGL